MRHPHPDIFETIALATSLHSGQRDKADIPYIAHPLAVMRKVPEVAQHVAVLHDVGEDCGVSPDFFAMRGYSETEVEALDLLTRREGFSYADYIERIATSGNEIAIAVKRADLTDNLDPRRILPDEPESGRNGREKRYRAALLRLIDAQGDAG